MAIFDAKQDCGRKDSAPHPFQFESDSPSFPRGSRYSSPGRGGRCRFDVGCLGPADPERHTHPAGPGSVGEVVLTPLGHRLRAGTRSRRFPLDPPVVMADNKLDHLEYIEDAMEWKLAEAKNKFSEVVRRALTEGPQRIRRRDSVVVVLSEDDFERLAGIRIDFKDFLLDGPDTHSLDLERSHDSMREIEL